MQKLPKQHAAKKLSNSAQQLRFVIMFGPSDPKAYAVQQSIALSFQKCAPHAP
jgi:hypothetical protein